MHKYNPPLFLLHVFVVFISVVGNRCSKEGCSFGSFWKSDMTHHIAVSLDTNLFLNIRVFLNVK